VNKKSTSTHTLYIIENSVISFQKILEPSTSVVVPTYSVTESQLTFYVEHAVQIRYLFAILFYTAVWREKIISQL